MGCYEIFLVRWYTLINRCLGSLVLNLSSILQGFGSLLPILLVNGSLFNAKTYSYFVIRFEAALWSNSQIYFGHNEFSCSFCSKPALGINSCPYFYSELISYSSLGPEFQVRAQFAPKPSPMHPTIMAKKRDIKAAEKEEEQLMRQVDPVMANRPKLNKAGKVQRTRKSQN